MENTIMSRAAIAAQADNAARAWCANPADPKPANPYSEAMQPDHFRAWAASFSRSLLAHSLLAHSAPECEASA